MTTDKKRTNQSLQEIKRNLLDNQIFHAVICRTIWFYCWIVYLTSRVEKVFDYESRKHIEEGHNAVIAFWHGRLLMQAFMRPTDKEMHVLISDHGDGRLISKIMTYFKVNTVNGSSSKGAIAAVKNMLKILKAGHNIVITPDGPRGPFQKAADGVVHVPLKSKVPIIPSSFSASRAIRLKSWDKFMIPLPFSKIVFSVGRPLYLYEQENKDMENLRVMVEDALNEVTADADMLAGFERKG